MTESASPCPRDELLVAYLTTSLSAAEESAIDTHLYQCDPCIATLQMVELRLAVAAEVPAAVPASVRERAKVPALQPATQQVPSPGWLTTLAQLLAGLTRLPILIPVGVAAGALLMLTTQMWMSPAGTHEMSRAVPMPQHLRITAPQAVVRAQPNGHAEVVATVERGTSVDIGGEERDWYRVALPNGTSGWVARQAFE